VKGEKIDSSLGWARGFARKKKKMSQAAERGEEEKRKL